MVKCDEAAGAPERRIHPTQRLAQDVRFGRVVEAATGDILHQAAQGLLRPQRQRIGSVAQLSGGFAGSGVAECISPSRLTDGSNAPIFVVSGCGQPKSETGHSVSLLDFCFAGSAA
jgi:hypothetical protein